MRLSQFVRFAQNYTATRSEVERVARKYLSQFFHEFDLPTPNVKLVKKLGVGWLARDKWVASDPDNTTLEINVYLIESEDQLDRIVAHEVNYRQLKQTACPCLAARR
jgi:hypothetical protein